MQVETTNRGMEFSFADDIIARKEFKTLNRPFIVGENAFAVFTKHPNGSTIRVDFGCKAAEDSENLGPTYEAKYWEHQRAVGAIEEPSPKAVSLNDISTYYYGVRINGAPWDGKTFYEKSEIFNEAPQLKNCLPSFTNQIVMSKTDKNSFPDSAPNREVYEKLKAQQTNFTRLPTATKPNSL